MGAMAVFASGKALTASDVAAYVDCDVDVARGYILTAHELGLLEPAGVDARTNPPSRRWKWATQRPQPAAPGEWVPIAADALLSPREAARRMGIGERQLQAWIDEGRHIEHVRVGPEIWFRRRAIDEARRLAA